MKALVYREFGSADCLEWSGHWQQPEVAPGCVLVRTRAGSVNPKDVLLRKGMFSRTLARDPLPRISGLDAAGEVIAVAKDVSGYRVGDRVFGMTNHFAGGVHAEVCRFHHSELARMPQGLSFSAAAAVPLAAQTALQALRDCADLQPGERVLINGASGGVGHFAVQIAKALGAEVHGVCGPDNVGFVESLGADAVYSYREQPAHKVSLAFDVVFDVFGKLSRPAFTRQLGRRGIYISTVPKLATFLGEGLARAGISNRSRLVEVRSRHEDLVVLAGWIEEGNLVPHVEKTFPVTAAAEAHRHVETKHTTGKVCIEF
ncbi:MAG: NAD(P)-dependent alcohol dehydrogenase [Marinobacter sp.]|uniref:NAD(P)-dependent alcohol dehydrogenase n=1 Tax=Marinobacter sp. TaxID=50741 RepID=UPI00299D74ED|nr:NAD(P)-dependent alcohol dehydrogenase [Marinobacter sp.]MDX1633897.1 NAD(P)-dependent alcohol dehydrogenase [Marinobacter sp.]